MFHEILKGSHYEMGVKFGLSLREEGQSLLANAPFPVTGERLRFARACEPLYRAYFPEILEEIAGLAKGQGCEEREIQALLFSMYCGCSCFAVSQGSQILLGRNSDFFTASEPYNMNVIYHFSGPSYDFTGNTTAYIEMEDGVNVHGLALGLTYVSPACVKPGFHAGLLLRFFLEKCRSTREVLEAVRRLPIASAQTITAADRDGEIAVVECSSQGMSILRPTEERPFVCAANHFCSPEMVPHQLPGDEWHSQTRYQTLTQALTRHGGCLDVPAAQELLAGKEGFLCQYDRSTGKDTVWSVVYDLTHRRIYRAEGNPGRCAFLEDKRF